MKPVNFPGSNLLLVAEDCDDLPAIRENGCILTLWQPSDKERELISQGKGVWLCVWGEQHPPVLIMAEGVVTEQ